ncbi:unnamed protein product, partial [Mesorhabditis spiculigera]
MGQAVVANFRRIAWKLPVQLITQKLLVEELAKVLAEDLGEADTPERAAVRQQGAERYGKFLEKLEELRAENQLRTDQSPWLFWYYEIDALSNLMLPTWIKAQYPAHELPKKLRISHNKYFEQLDKLVGEYPEEAVEAVIAQLVLNRIHEIGEKYEEIYKKWMSRKTDKKKYCAGKMVAEHPRWTDALSLERIYKKRDLDSIPKLMDKVRVAFREIIHESPWADPPTQEVAIEKINNISMHVGYAHVMWPRSRVEQYYEGYTPADAPDWATFREKRKRWTGFKQFNDSLASTNAVVNALNTYDKIRILWGILAPPLYSSTDALEMIYGGVGFTIGHELGHTIDPNSIDRSPPVLIGAEDAEQFEEQVECIQHQYGNQTLPLNTLDDVFRQPGDLTHGETVADNVGLRSSFRAYRKERQRVYGKKEKRLPGLESYTPDQLYFIAAAMFWCGEASDDRLVGALENVHPPGVFRVNEMMKNSNEFARAYKCPLNSPMNPAKKCRVWRHKKRH